VFRIGGDASVDEHGHGLVADAQLPAAARALGQEIQAVVPGQIVRMERHAELLHVPRSRAQHRACRSDSLDHPGVFQRGACLDGDVHIFRHQADRIAIQQELDPKLRMTLQEVR
jgi:hypothetical protein